MTFDDAAARVARLEGAARRAETPCGDGTMVWRSWGEGRPLVLFHGGYGSWTHWLRNIPALIPHRRVICADLPGAGDSAAAPEPYTPESIAAIVAGGLERLLGRDESCDIGGFSFGGIIGGHVAAALGTRCRSLTLCGSNGLGLRRGPRDQPQSWRGTPDPEARAAIHRRNLEVLMFGDPAAIDDVAVYLQMQNAERGRTRSPQFAQTDTLARVLPRLKGRLAGIWGERDNLAWDDLSGRARILRGVQPDAPFIVIPGAGHWVVYEAADAVNEIFPELLARGEAAKAAE